MVFILYLYKKKIIFKTFLNLAAIFLAWLLDKTLTEAVSLTMKIATPTQTVPSGFSDPDLLEAMTDF